MAYKNSLEGTALNETRLTFALPNTVTQADVGKAVSVDTSADDAAKLALDGEEILGMLLTVETEGAGSLAKTYGTVQILGGYYLPVATGSTMTRGSAFVGALDSVDTSNSGAGYIRPPTTPAQSATRFVSSIAKQSTERTVTVLVM